MAGCDKVASSFGNPTAQNTTNHQLHHKELEAVHKDTIHLNETNHPPTFNLTQPCEAEGSVISEAEGTVISLHTCLPSFEVSYNLTMDRRFASMSKLDTEFSWLSVDDPRKLSPSPSTKSAQSAATDPGSSESTHHTHVLLIVKDHHDCQSEG